MVRYKVTLAYDGTAFLGFQYQPEGRTVQDEVEKSLRRIQWEGIRLKAAGRTDSGVHASGQVIAFDLDWRHSPQELLRAMNAHLPSDVAARDITPVKSDFDPRRHAVSRRYLYRIIYQEIRDPLRERYAWRIWPPADFVMLNETASKVIGEHDFQAFGSPPRAESSTIRTIKCASWSPSDNAVVFEVVANAFLYHMVRRIVFSAVRVGLGKSDLKEIDRFLNPIANPGIQVKGLAPPQGLFLTEVLYPAESLVSEEA